MSIILSILSCLATALAGYVLLMNWLCVIRSSQNRRRGIDKHYSPVPVVGLFLCAIAWGARHASGFSFPPRVLIMTLVLVDPTVWSLIALPFFRLRRKAQQNR